MNSGYPECDRIRSDMRGDEMGAYVPDAREGSKPRREECRAVRTLKAASRRTQGGRRRARGTVSRSAQSAREDRDGRSERASCFSISVPQHAMSARKRGRGPSFL